MHSLNSRSQGLLSFVEIEAIIHHNPWVRYQAHLFSQHLTGVSLGCHQILSMWVKGLVVWYTCRQEHTQTHRVDFVNNKCRTSRKISATRPILINVYQCRIMPLYAAGTITSLQQTRNRGFSLNVKMITFISSALHMSGDSCH
jgi:hypothetical protein